MRAAETGRTWLTERLRLVPVGPEHAADLLTLHRTAAVAEWYGEYTSEKALRRATEMGQAWARDGVGKWMAYDRAGGALVGRGGLSRQELGGEDRLEVGWVVHPDLWGRGYATEMGRAGLSFAFDELGAEEVVAYTEPENRRSRAVMERLGMRYSHEFTRHGIEFVLYTLGRPKTRRLTAHPGTIAGDPEDLVHLDWSEDWRPSTE